MRKTTATLGLGLVGLVHAMGALYQPTSKLDSQPIKEQPNIVCDYTAFQGIKCGPFKYVTEERCYEF